METDMVVLKNGEVWATDNLGEIVADDITLGEITCPDDVPFFVERLGAAYVEAVARFVFLAGDDDASVGSRGIGDLFADDVILTTDEGLPLTWPLDGQVVQVWRRARRHG